MQSFKRLFPKTTSIIGMIHVDPLPGTPQYESSSLKRLVEKARHEANIYKQNEIHAVLVENMNDIPYIKSSKFGPEITAIMTAVTLEVQRILQSSTKKIPVGVQVLACGGKEALAVAKATSSDFIRNEGFIFSHIGDEGFIDSNAGELLRYRKMIDADNIMIFNDIKKKHSSHAITSDISLLDTANAAMFFNADGIILTGKSTGDSTDVNELKLIHKQQQEGKLKLPILVGSGVTKKNLHNYVGFADALIIGSYFKHNGHWNGEVSNERIRDFMQHLNIITNSIKTNSP